MFSRTYPAALLLAAFSTIFVACGKEDSVTPGAASGKELKGSYDFVNLTVIVTTNTTQTQFGETVRSTVKTYYITKDNKGIVTFDGGTLKNTGFAYTVDTTVLATSTIDGVTEEFEMPFTFTLPETNSTSPYKLKGVDSLVFAGGSVQSPVFGGGETPSLPGVSNYKWKGDTLVLTQGINLRVGTAGVTTVHTGTTMMKLKKRS